MSTKSRERTELLAALSDEFRQLSTATVLFHQAIDIYSVLGILVEEALRAGHHVLDQGGESVEAVVAAIRVLEDSSLFNAGKALGPFVDTAMSVRGDMIDKDPAAV